MAFVETLAATALGGGFALLGAWVTNKFNRQNSEDQRHHEKWKAKRDSYLTKGEETYSIFNQWMVNASKITTMYAFRASGAYDAQQLEARLKDVDMHGLTPKLTALIEIYFPELAASFKDIQKKIFDIHFFYAQNLDRSPNAEVAIDITDQGSEFVVQCEKFLGDLGKIVKSYQ